MNTKTWMTFLGIGAALALISGALQPFYLCGDSWRWCMSWNYFFGLPLQPFIIFFLTFLLVSRTSKKIFNTWSSFALVWIPMSVLAVFLAPEYRTDFLYGFDKSSVAFLMSMLFVVGSLCILAWQRKHL